MIYIQDENKQNRHPIIMVRNKGVQFSDKMKKYPDTILSSENSWQITKSQEEKSNVFTAKMAVNPERKDYSPQVSNFQAMELKELSKQISLKNISCMSHRKSKFRKQSPKEWQKMIMQPSKAEILLLQKIQDMLDRQSFKPTFSTATRRPKNYCFNTMATQTVFHSQKTDPSQSSVINSIDNKNQKYCKSISPDHNKTTTLSDLINLSKFSTLSNKTLEKYLLCIEKQIHGSQLEKSRKISEFNLLDTQRSKQIVEKQLPKNETQAAKSKYSQEIQAQIQQIYKKIPLKQKTSNKGQSITILEMLLKIKAFVTEHIKTQNEFSQNQNDKREEQSTCLLDE